MPAFGVRPGPDAPPGLQCAARSPACRLADSDLDVAALDSAAAAAAPPDSGDEALDARVRLGDISIGSLARCPLSNVIPASLPPLL